MLATTRPDAANIAIVAKLDLHHPDYSSNLPVTTSSFDWVTLDGDPSIHHDGRQSHLDFECCHCDRLVMNRRLA